MSSGAPESFQAALEAARASIVHTPEDAVVRVVAEQFGLTTDPLDERGSKGPWHRHGYAVDVALRLMVLGFGMTQRDAAERMGYSPARCQNDARVRSSRHLTADELDLYDDAEARIGRSVAGATDTIGRATRPATRGT